jgi:hypothetical protein
MTKRKGKAVIGYYSFYRLPSLETYQKWADEVDHLNNDAEANAVRNAD